MPARIRGETLDTDVGLSTQSGSVTLLIPADVDPVKHLVTKPTTAVRRLSTYLPRCILGDNPVAGILRAAVEHNAGHVGVYTSVLRAGRVRRGDPVAVA